MVRSCQASFARHRAVTLRIVVDTLLGLIDYEVPAGIGARSVAADDATDDERAEAVVESVRASVLAWGQGHLGEIASSGERIGSLITDTRWSGLHDDVQVMMATADLVGHDLDANADFSGPVIGMCAAVEHILYACTIEPVVAAVPAWQKQVRTFGAALDAVDFACQSGGSSQLHRALRAHLNSTGIDVATVASLLPLWRQMNSIYRVPAAHREILTKAQWQQLYGLLMGSDHLFVRTFDALVLPATVAGP